MNKHYLFFTRNTLPQPRADLVQVANCANAAANLGYSTVLTYLDQQACPLRWLKPFDPHAPEPSFKQFYHLQDRLKVAGLPMPEFLNRVSSKWAHPSTVVSKYYFPMHMRATTQIVHTRDWNFVKAAVRSGVPAIYEHHHHENKRFEPEIVHHPLFQIAVTVADSVRESMIQYGMPSDRVIKLHNGFNQSFLARHPEAAAVWRHKLLQQHRALAVYSGGLNAFKGVNLLIEAARSIPDVLVVFAGGSAEQVTAYRQFAAQHQVKNVKFLGYLLHDQLASLLQAADVLVHPHRSGAEASFTSPLKFFDYMASGTPIVATEIPVLVEFRSSGVVAGWCEPDAATPLAACIRQVLQTHPRQPDGYHNAMQFVQQFSWENRIATVLSRVKDSLRPALA